MSAHTPGPLVVIRGWSAMRTVASIACAAPHMVSVAVPEGQTVEIDLATALANGHLYAAASELLELARRSVKIIDTFAGVMRLEGWHESRIAETLAAKADYSAAIDKAEGR